MYNNCSSLYKRKIEIVDSYKMRTYLIESLEVKSNFKITFTSFYRQDILAKNI